MPLSVFYLWQNIFADIINWVNETTRDVMEPNGMKVIVGRRGAISQTCFYSPEERPICFYCKRTFPDVNALVFHLLLINDVPDRGILCAMHSSSVPATSRIGRRPVNDRSMFTPDIPITIKPSNHNVVHSPSAEVWNVGNVFAEGGTIKTEPQNDRSSLTPDMSNMQPFDRKIVPNASAALGHNFDGYEFGGEEIIKNEPDID